MVLLFVVPLCLLWKTIYCEVELIRLQRVKQSQQVVVWAKSVLLPAVVAECFVDDLAHAPSRGQHERRLFCAAGLRALEEQRSVPSREGLLRERLAAVPAGDPDTRAFLAWVLLHEYGDRRMLDVYLGEIEKLDPIDIGTTLGLTLSAAGGLSITDASRQLKANPDALRATIRGRFDRVRYSQRDRIWEPRE